VEDILRGLHLNDNEGTQNTKKKIDNSLQIFGITRNQSLFKFFFPFKTQIRLGASLLNI